ncbi:Keratin-associated protein [Trinorchestia longiramus]|nr:Keratin-associated protein [Trinorchestia longiramus]
MWLSYTPDVNPLDYASWSHIEAKACRVRRPNITAVKASVDWHITLYSTTQYSITLYSIIQYNITQYSITQYSITQPSIIQHSIIQHNIIQHSIIQHSIIQHSITQPSIIQPSIIQPSITQPSIMQPSITQPSITQPSITQPSITQPSITQPSITQPSIMQYIIKRSSTTQESNKEFNNNTFLSIQTAITKRTLPCTVTEKGNEQRTRHKQIKKRAAPPPQRLYLNSLLQQASLVLQETLSKPQDYRQPEHINKDNLSKVKLTRHQMKATDMNPSQDGSQTPEFNRKQGKGKKQAPRTPDQQNKRGTGEHTDVDNTDHNLKQLKILVGNLQSLLPKMQEIQAIASTLSYDIMAVNETWLDLNGRGPPAKSSLKRYILYNVDKPSYSKRGGGSLVYIEEKLRPQIKAKRATEKSEILHLTIEPHLRHTIRIVLVYRNLICTAIDDDKFYDYLDNIFSAPHETLITVGFNLSNINWTSRQSRASAYLSDEYKLFTAVCQGIV